MREIFSDLKISQIGLVVNNIEQMMQQYYSKFGWEPWSCYTYDTTVVPRMMYRGQPANARWKIAMVDIGSLNFELVEPLSKGDNIFDEFLVKNHFGLHHIGVNVADAEQMITRAKSVGIKVIQSGSGFGANGDGHFVFLDTISLLGLVVELRELPKKRVPPQAIFPPN